MAGDDIKARIGGDFTEFQKSMRKMERKLSNTIRKMEKIGNGLSRSVTAPLVAMGALSTKIFTDFEQSMLKVKAIGNVTGDSFTMLENKAKSLGETTMFTASQVATLQLNLTKLGFNPNQINGSTEAILRLAQATDSDLAESATVAASTLRGFNLEVSEITRVTNVMTDAFSSSALDMEKYKVAMAVVAPVAKQAGASIEETTAILGTLVNRGVDASSAGAALRNIFLDLADKGLTFSEAMDMVNNSTNPLADSMELFGKRGATVATIIANNRGEINGLTSDLQDSSGEAKRAADIMDSGLGGVFRRLRSQIEAAAIQFGQDLKPAIISVTNVISKMLKAWMQLSEGTRANIVKFALLAASLGPVVLGMAKLLGVVKMIVGWVGKGMLFNPWVLAATAIAYIAYEIYRNWDEVKVILAKVINYYIDLYNESIVFRAVVQGTVSHFKNMFEMIKAIIASIRNMASTYKGVFKAITSGKFNFGEVLKDSFKKQNEISFEMAKNIAKNIKSAVEKTAIKPNIEAVKAEDLFKSKKEIEKEIEENSDLGSLGGGFSFGSGKGSGNKTVVHLDVDTTEIDNTKSKLDSISREAVVIPINIQDPEPVIHKYQSRIGRFLKHVGEELEEKFKEAVESVANMFSELGNRIFSIVNQVYDNKEQRIENAATKEINAINNSILNEEDRAAMVERIEENKAKKLAELQRKQAIASKAQAIFDATIATAVAVAQTIANPILAAAVGTLGAIQIAAIAAEPLPALAKGGLAYGQTTAIVGDNPNASVDPEVIAPLSKLKDIIGNVGTNHMHLTGAFRLRGADAEVMVRDSRIRKNRMYGAA